MPKNYPTPPRNPALDPFRGRDWSRALNPSAKLRSGPRRRVFVIEQDCRRFVIVAANIIKANQRFNAIYP